MRKRPAMAVSNKRHNWAMLIMVSMVTLLCVSKGQAGQRNEPKQNAGSLGFIDSKNDVERRQLSDSDSSVEDFEEDDDFLVKDEPPRLRDIGYLFAGYNILRGNPVEKGNMDPGIRGYQIFQTTYKRNNTSPDGTFSMPDGSTVRRTKSCSVSFKSKSLSTEKSYVESMNVGVEASGGYGGFAFKASVDYQHKTEEIRTGKSVFVRTESTCSIYKGTVDQSSPPKLHPSFISEVKQLGNHLKKNKLTDGHLVDLVERFGTHFITDALFGARYGMEYQFSQESYQRMKEEGVNVKVSAEYAGLFTAGVSASSETNKKDAEKFEKESKDKFIYSYGTQIPQDGNEMTWASKTAEEPLPIKVWIKGIHKLFNKRYLKGLGKTFRKNLKHLRHIVKDFVRTKYCQILQRRGEVIDCLPVKETWAKLNEQRVCFGARGRNPGSFIVAQNYLISAIKLVHRSGKITCDLNHAHTLSNWGCGSFEGISVFGLNVFLKYRDGPAKTYIFPQPHQRDFKWLTQGSFKDGGWYTIKGFNSNSDSLEFHLKGDVPHTLPKNKEVEIWYGEDMFGWYADDNGGNVCVDVFGRLR